MDDEELEKAIREIEAMHTFYKNEQNESNLENLADAIAKADLMVEMERM